jgi:hypothetical protein
MNLKIIAINDKGNIEKEVVWLEAIAECNLQYFLICDTTYTDQDHVSNELRHLYWMPNLTIKKGDLIALHTRVGTNSSALNDRKTTTYHRYWNLGKSVWNKDGDCAILFNVKTWKATRA